MILLLLIKKYGDTRDDQKCNHDATHRVCAKIGLTDYHQSKMRLPSSVTALCSIPSGLC